MSLQVLCAITMLSMLGLPMLCQGQQREEPYSFGIRFASGGTYGGSRPLITPDGKSVLFGSPTEKGLGDLCSVDIDGKNWKQLTSTGHYEGNPDVSSDGKKIVFESERDGKPYIFIMSINGTNVRRLTTGTFPEHRPVFSPDGSKVAFARHLGKDPDDFLSNEVFVADTAGMNLRRLTDNAIGDWPVAFSRNLSHVYVISGSDEFNLVSVDLKDGARSMVIPFKAKGLACDVSEDETKVVFTSDRVNPYQYELFVCDIDGKNVRQLTSLKGYISDVRFKAGSSKEVTFVWEKNAGESRGVGMIYQVDCGNGRVQSICENMRPPIKQELSRPNSPKK